MKNNPEGTRFTCEIINIEVINEINLITNLNTSYSNQQIIDLYKRRWDVEVFFPKGPATLVNLLKKILNLVK